MFVVKKLTFSGSNVETSDIEFLNGLNIVYGPSNTGKTYIIDSIDYMFGGEEFPLSDTIGYTTIEIEVETDDGILRIIRNKDTNTVATIISSIDYIESKDYALKPGNGKVKKDTLSDVWLKLLGIYEHTEIYKNEDLATQAFTTRAFNHVFMIKEDYVHQKDSIIKKGNKSITSIKAALLYLLNDTNYIVKSDEDNKTKATKRKALETYLNEQIGFISSKQEELKEKVNIDVELAQKQIDDAVNELGEYQNKMSLILSSNKTIYSKLNSLNSTLSEDLSLHKKYKALKTQYSSDLKRLQLIIEGEVNNGLIKKPVRCPFCNGELKKKEEVSCIEAAKVEIENLIPRINDLSLADKELNDEIISLQAEVDKINAEKDANNEIINKELKPKIYDLKSKISQLTMAIENSKEAEMLLEFEKRYKSKLNELNNEAESVTKFEPNDLLGSTFIDEMNQSISTMLQESNYQNYKSSYFDIGKFDIVVNGQTKSTQGKGFRAFLNTTLAFSLHTYLKNHAEHFMNLLIIDSPILTLKENDDLKEREDKQIANSMKNGLMKYFDNNCEGRQVIIIENEIPKIEYNNANIIQFTKTDEGRYGLLKSVRQ